MNTEAFPASSQALPASLQAFLVDEVWHLLSQGSEPLNYQITPLAHKSSNTTYRLVLGESAFFIKHMQATSFIPFQRVERFRLQSQLSELDWAPKPIAISKDGLWQLEAWEPQHSGCPRAVLTERAGQLLAQLHETMLVENTSMDAPVLDLVSHWRWYSSRLDQQRQAYFKPQVSALAPQWQNLEKTCLCHHDLALNHIASVERHILYDWEYAAIGSPYFDLAGAVAVNGFTEVEEIEFLRAYAQAQSKRKALTEADLKNRVDAVKPLVALTNELWGAVYDAGTV